MCKDVYTYLYIYMYIYIYKYNFVKIYLAIISGWVRLRIHLFSGCMAPSAFFKSLLFPRWRDPTFFKI